MGVDVIELERTGRWIERESDTEDKENGFKTVIVCSCCDFPATTFYSEDCESRTQIRTDFCPRKKTGRCILTGKGKTRMSIGNTYACSECGWETIGKANYCPCCGARMES